VLDGHALGKPGDQVAALTQLDAMRGRIVVFHTAICVLQHSTSRREMENVPTTVAFRNYSHAQAKRYLEIDRPYDCAGSAKIESLGIALASRVESSDPTALIGLPLIALTTLLARFGIDVL
jgi:septum formation protein